MAWAEGRIRPLASLSTTKALVCWLRLISTKGLHAKKRLIRRKRTSRSSFAGFRVCSCRVKLARRISMLLLPNLKECSSLG